jgi:hypothetical protein
MLTSILLFILLLVQTAYSLYRDNLNNKEKNKLINALLSKTAQDMVAFEATDKLNTGETMPIPPDFTSLDEVGQDEWDKLVLNDEKP